MRGYPIRCLMERHASPPERASLGRRVLPFAAASILAFALVPLPPHRERVGLVWVAAVLTVIIICAAVLTPWERLPSGLQGVPALLYFVVIALLRHAEGGAISGYGALVVLPVFRIALYGTLRQLIVALGFMVLTFALPIVLIGPPGYPDAEWRRVLVWLIVGPLVGFTVHRLVADLNQRSRQLSETARTDVLTGLPNRRAWDEGLGRELSSAARAGAPTCVAILDLDHFKQFNDTRGHQAGDALLKEAAAAWRGELRPRDFLARYGGEEFALVLPDCTMESAGRVVERLRAATPADQTCSAGIACWDGSESADSLVARADGALYQAKKSGRDRYEIAAA
jgi:diguanylate cyclase (GGDEF)-like protein